MSLISEENVRGGSVFRDLSADDEDWQPTEIESMCMNCHLNGTTRLLLTKIPFFKEIIVSSFSCANCNWSNTEIQSAGRIQEQGVCYTLRVRTKQDLNREVVKADCAVTRIPELDFEIPAFTQKGSLSTVEGLLDRAVAGLEQDQPARHCSSVSSCCGRKQMKIEASILYTSLMSWGGGVFFPTILLCSVDKIR
uniref:ZPR1 zinc finger n=1 Tax=Fundulus heteroclitus TaxID=8078 RepID=A0A3Q2Q978_FUNHE